MSEELSIGNLEGFLRQLNANLKSGDNSISAADFKDTTPGKNPLTYSARGWELISRGHYNLIQMQQFFVIAHDTNIGYAHVERIAKEKGEYSPLTDCLEIVLTEPQQMNNGDIIPTCSIHVEIAGGWGSEPLQRTDRVKRLLGFWWQKKDLTKTIPTEWFYGKPANGYVNGDIKQDPWAELDQIADTELAPNRG